MAQATGGEDSKTSGRRSGRYYRLGFRVVVLSRHSTIDIVLGEARHHHGAVILRDCMVNLL